MNRVPIITNIYGSQTILGCGDCIHWQSYLDTERNLQYASTCPRADGRIVRFAPNVFTGHPSDSHLICGDFQPLLCNIHLAKNWIGFDEYIKKYIYFWDKDLGYKDVPFILEGNLKVKYMMNAIDYMYGNMWKPNGKFNVHSAYCYKQAHMLLGGELIYKDIDGVMI